MTPEEFYEKAKELASQSGCENWSEADVLRFLVKAFSGGEIPEGADPEEYVAALIGKKAVVCPLRLMRAGDEHRDDAACIGERCAWWVHGNEIGKTKLAEGCAVMQMGWTAKTERLDRATSQLYTTRIFAEAGC